MTTSDDTRRPHSSFDAFVAEFRQRQQASALEDDELIPDTVVNATTIINVTVRGRLARRIEPALLLRALETWNAAVLAAENYSLFLIAECGNEKTGGAVVVRQTRDHLVFVFSTDGTVYATGTSSATAAAANLIDLLAIIHACLPAGAGFCHLADVRLVGAVAMLATDTRVGSFGVPEASEHSRPSAIVSVPEDCVFNRLDTGGLIQVAIDAPVDGEVEFNVLLNAAYMSRFQRPATASADQLPIDAAAESSIDLFEK